MRLYLDEDAMADALVAALRSRDSDVETAEELSHRGWSDEQHLLHASQSTRVLYSFNRRDYLRIHTRWMTEGRHHAGVVLFSRRIYDAGYQLRGLVDGSLVRTVTRVKELIGSRRVAVQIDPQAFDRYAVTRTPSFVLVRDGAPAAPCANGLCVPGDGYVMAAGDVSLDYALGFFQRSAPSFAKDAGAFLKRLKAQSG